MSVCKPIIGLKLDSKSLATLERIEEKANLGKLLGIAANVGVFHSIFTKNRAPVVAYNITQTDWGETGSGLFYNVQTCWSCTPRSIHCEQCPARMEHFGNGLFRSAFGGFAGLSNGVCR